MEEQAPTTVTKPEMVTPNELIWKHIKDPSHVITEEEFSKLVVGLSTINPVSLSIGDLV